METDGEWEEGSGWLAALAPLRADVSSGDLRLFYLLWLTAVEEELVPDDEVEPLPGIAPLTGRSRLSPDFSVSIPTSCRRRRRRARATRRSPTGCGEMVAAIPEDEKTGLLLRVVEGDTLVAIDLKRRIQEK